ncbi:flagellar motor switch protein FliN [Limoniibacter endophyticus]|uniref:Flagellar motor switch protein FliN n=1 Tax=Limoniibacter endophyticus TaxID=1565040 RepID=A0A8J3DPS4_9HYPH|nr:flagellar motor switch protein FliN [Limoniibacter endophyticus]GHC64642.1 flagellar motor switch protein FliN [Limoniibacter endophyticus]
MSKATAKLAPEAAEETVIASSEESKQVNAETIEELQGVLLEQQKRSGREEPPKNDLIMNIPVEVQIVLGSTTMSVSELMSLQKGATIALDRRIGEPVDVVVNGRRIARGEITVLENDPSRFGIQLIEIISGN